jgi:pimeloyl-ACP methyl ester carboxylesterase
MTAGYCATMIVGFAHCTMGADFLAWARTFGGPRELSEIRCPVWLIFPQHDRTLPRKHHAPQLLAAISDLDVIERPHVGHVAMSDDPVAVAQSITDFTLRGAGGCGLGVPHATR